VTPRPKRPQDAPPPTGASDLFLGLTPDRVLAAVESAGLAVRPVCYPLNSFENRVYEVELADRSRAVAKFYRPGRWSASQIEEEHRFLAELDREEIPVCPAREFPGGGTLREIAGRPPILYAIFDRKGGRAPDELTAATARRLGQLAARLHVVGARRPEADRPRLDGTHYLLRDLPSLGATGLVPARLLGRWSAAARAIGEACDRLLARVPRLRLHGDLHLGNVLERDGQLRLLDFDDCRIGPAVQDLWLALPGRDAATEELRRHLLEGYETFRPFDRAELALVEPLRGLRMAQYAVWLARRWHDPVFPRTWPQFGTEDHWERETADLEAQAARVERVERGQPADPEPGEAAGEELTNADLFWDWQEPGGGAS
jgi:Ser/Thr protein kinase RdoA (MazF antagonist)